MFADLRRAAVQRLSISPCASAQGGAGEAKPMGGDTTLMVPISEPLAPGDCRVA